MENYNEILDGKNIIIFGCGSHFRNLYNNLKEQGYNLLISYICDNNEGKKGELITLGGGQQIVIDSPEILKSLSAKQCIVLIASTFVREIIHQIKLLNNDMKYYTLDYIAGLVRRDVISSLPDNYNVNYMDNIIKWVGLAKQDELGFWDLKLASLTEDDKINLQEREFVYPYHNMIINEETCVLDLGSGPLPLYGNLYKGKKFNYIPVDPLAHQYKRLRDKFNIKLPVEPIFGIMEHMTLFYKQNSIDYIIVNNALDHCIDIIRALIEMLSILKKNGVISLVHNECVGFRWSYNGLHQWDITKNDLNELLIADRKSNRINVSRLFSKFASIKVTEKITDDNNDPLLGGGGINKIIVDIKKTRDVPDILIETMSNKIAGGALISVLFNEIYRV